MYLKIGDDKLIDKRKILAILDIKQISAEIPQNCKKTDKYKSLILIDDNGEEVYMLSHASTQTLLRRAELGNF